VNKLKVIFGALLFIVGVVAVVCYQIGYELERAYTTVYLVYGGGILGTIGGYLIITEIQKVREKKK
jgi:hypothetical protein